MDSLIIPFVVKNLDGKSNFGRAWAAKLRRRYGGGDLGFTGFKINEDPRFSKGCRLILRI